MELATSECFFSSGCLRRLQHCPTFEAQKLLYMGWSHEYSFLTFLYLGPHPLFLEERLAKQGSLGEGSLVSSGPHESVLPWTKRQTVPF